MTAGLTHHLKYYSAKSVATLYPSPWQHYIHLHGNIVTIRAGAGKIGYKMDRFVINFDLFGDLSLDERLEEDEKNQTTKK